MSFENPYDYSSIEIPDEGVSGELLHELHSRFMDSLEKCLGECEGDLDELSNAGEDFELSELCADMKRHLDALWKYADDVKYQEFCNAMDSAATSR